MDLKTEHLSKRYRRPPRGRTPSQELNVLSDITLDIPAGQFVTIIGPSGCGKSTLLNCIAGLLPYDDGLISIDGVPVRDPGPGRAVVFQAPSLLPWRTVRSNVAYGLELLGGLTRQEVEARVDDALRTVGLSEFEGHYPHELSGGMQQRVNLARALATQPGLLLMDEPFGALDAMTKQRMQDELSAMLDASRTVIFVTHDIEEAVFLGDRVVVMSPRPGRVVADMEVPLPRPRRRDVTEEPAFLGLVRSLRQRLEV